MIEVKGTIRKMKKRKSWLFPLKTPINLHKPLLKMTKKKKTQRYHFTVMGNWWNTFITRLAWRVSKWSGKPGSTPEDSWDVARVRSSRSDRPITRTSAFLFATTFFFESIVDSQIVLKSNKEVPSTHHPVWSSCLTEVQRHNQETDINAPHWVVQISSVLYACVCVHVCTCVFGFMEFNHVCRFLWPPPQPKCRSSFSTRALHATGHWPLSFSLASQLRARYWTLGVCSNNEKSISQCDPEVCQGPTNRDPILPDAPLILGSMGSPHVAIGAAHRSVSEGTIHVMALLCDSRPVSSKPSVFT